MMRPVSYTHLQNVNFVGVHTGTLGFFTDFQKDEVMELVEAIKSECYHPVSYTHLDVYKRQA